MIQMEYSSFDSTQMKRGSIITTKSASGQKIKPGPKVQAQASENKKITLQGTLQNQVFKAKDTNSQLLDDFEPGFINQSFDQFIKQNHETGNI